jgi:RNA polymerase sigma-70 factor (ECF subfamily)
MEADRDDAKVAGLLAEEPWLRRLALRIDGARAEDLAQDALVAALAAPAPRGRLRAWLAGILRNVARETRRREMRRERREERAARADAGVCPLESAALLEARALVTAAVRDLPEPYRKTVLLHFFEGLSLAEIARRTGEKDSTVRNRLHRALRRLRRGFEEGFGGAPLSLVPVALGGWHARPRLFLARIAVAAAVLAGAVHAGTPREKERKPRPAPVASPREAPRADVPPAP